MDHWEIVTSSGRRVSLLCADETDYSSWSSNVAPTPPLSPDHLKRRPHRACSMESSASSVSSVEPSSPRRVYSPPTPPNLFLPPLEKLIPVSEHHFFPPLPSRSNSFSTSPIVSPLSSTMEENVIPTVSQAPSIATISNPPSPKSSSAASPVIKRSSRRYTCQCGKSFTTSGHLARHTRIHTGEKNYVCPEPNCGARFSRQDNCMQHYRTHQSGSASKRAARRRRLSADSAMSGRDTDRDMDSSVPVHHHQRSLSYHATQPFSYTQLEPFKSEGGLAALATAAIASYQ
ncbi:hypothetical protein BDZ91DRAFT_711668 [Kalaharituber pfeilii]|nr:hypothetical protein BDZ91DRAFT_711668 [Kalaharituber pfeilii]